MNRKILLVEDEALIAMQESRILQKHGFEVYVAYSGEKAIAAVRDDPAIALVLMDIDLGAGIDGTEAAQRILHTHKLPIVFLTSHSEKEIVDKVKGISRYGYVLKNSGVFVLVESINMAFELFDAHQATRARERRQQQQMEELEAIYRHTPALMVLVNSQLEVRKANTAAAEFANATTDTLKGSRIGEALRCLNHLNHPQGCGYSPACRECSVRTTVLSTLKTKKNHLRVSASIPVHSVQHSDGEVNFLLSSVYLSLRDEPTVLVTIEEKIQTSSQKYRSLFNSIRDAILVASLISLKESAGEESIDLSDVVNQIHTIKLVHERLYCRDNATHTELNAYFSEILNSVFSAWPHIEVRIELDIDKITVPSSTAVTLGLITNEIATNALKYGFRPNDGPHNFAAALHEVPAGSRSYIYSLSNSGPPFPAEVDPSTADSLGMQLLTILVDQLHGTLRLQKTPHPVFTVRFPSEKTALQTLSQVNSTAAVENQPFHLQQLFQKGQTGL